MSKATRGQGQLEGWPRLLGDRLCFNFVNTVEGPLSQHPQEYMGSAQRLAAWGEHVGLLSADDHQRLLLANTADSDALRRGFEHGLRLRSTLTQVFRALAHDRDPAPVDLDSLQEDYRTLLERVRLVPASPGFDWRWEGQRDANFLLWSVTHSAMELLMRGDPARIRECPGAGDCGWLFYDTSRNGTRRWCSMEGCGSRVKMRRHYSRHRRSSN